MLLSPYRVLDLSDEKGLFCGKILADLGADVVLIEPPGGHPCRHIGPFYKDIPHPQNSLYWWALNANKRSLTLDIQTPRGRDIFRQLARRADFVIESFPPGHVAGLGLGYERLAAPNPGLILVSISPFGQTGPYRDYKTSDMVAMAMGGVVFATGDPDRPPVRPSAEQAYLMAGVHGAAASLTALFSRAGTGQGQWLDISIHECLLIIACPDVVAWDFQRIMPRRLGATIVRGGYQAKAMYPCRDGQIAFRVGGASWGEGVRTLVEWMDSQGQAGILKDFSWAPEAVKQLTPEERQRHDEVFAQFFLQHTKAEIFDQAVKRGFYVQPANTIPEVLADPQLQARGFWQEIEHPEAGRSFSYSGPPFGPTLPRRKGRRAPLPGEDNQDIYGGELGASPTELERWRQEGVI